MMFQILDLVIGIMSELWFRAGKTNRSQNLFYFTNEPFPCGEDYGYNPRNHTVTSLDVVSYCRLLVSSLVVSFVIEDEHVTLF